MKWFEALSRVVGKAVELSGGDTLESSGSPSNMRTKGNDHRRVLATFFLIYTMVIQFVAALPMPAVASPSQPDKDTIRTKPENDETSGPLIDEPDEPVTILGPVTVRRIGFR